MHIKYKTFLFKYLVLIVTMSICCEQDGYKGLYGRWKFYKYTILYGKVGRSNLNEDKMIKYLIGKQIILNKNYIIIDRKRYERPIYKIREENADEYFIWFWRINKHDIGIRDGTDKIKVLNIYMDDREKEKTVGINWPVDGREEHLSFDEIVYYEGKLGVCYDTYFFYLKKVK